MNLEIHHIVFFRSFLDPIPFHILQIEIEIKFWENKDYHTPKITKNKKYTVVDKKNATPFGTFFAMIISLWVFETQIKNWYHWREEILNFVMMCLVCSYSHLFKRYGCVSENDTLCLHHILKIFCLCKVSVIKIILQNFIQKIVWL